ncbi:T3JAM protein, partial [Geococcyx californianus]|nr:T3JAM protein [Geococcyx californianus]
MINQPEKSRLRHRRMNESYDEKCERRHEKRENLRWRNNRTTCRRIRRGAGQMPQSPRQREFLRRRNLASDAGRTPPGQEPKGCIPLDLSSQLDPRSPILLQPLSIPHKSFWRDTDSAAFSFQNPWSCPTLPPAQSLIHFSIPFGTLAEAVPRRGASTNTQGIQVVPADLLSLSLQEALHRELLLKQKMLILQELFSTLLEASEKSWQGQLNEDKLKCKLRALENQLQACTQSYSKECVKKILIEMEDQKQTYEQKAKEALQKMLEDKLQTEQQMQNSQRSLAAMREDLAFWKEHYTTLKAELTKMTTAHTELENNFHTLQSELQQAATQKEQLQEALHTLQSERAALHQRVSALQEDNDLKAEHISMMEDKLQKEQNQKITLEATISHLHNLIQNQSNKQKSQEGMEQRKDQVFTSQTPPLTPAKKKQNAQLERPKEEASEERLKDEIQKRTSQLTAKEMECTELRSELEALSEEYRSCLTRLRQCRDELNHFQSKQAKHSHWIPLLVALTAIAIATFLATCRP